MAKKRKLISKASFPASPEELNGVWVVTDVSETEVTLVNSYDVYYRTSWASIVNACKDCLGCVVEIIYKGTTKLKNGKEFKIFQVFLIEDEEEESADF